LDFYLEEEVYFSVRPGNFYQITGHQIAEYRSLRITYLGSNVVQNVPLNRENFLRGQNAEHIKTCLEAPNMSFKSSVTTDGRLESAQINSTRWHLPHAL
jgi:hypothetical protein